MKRFVFPVVMVCLSSTGCASTSENLQRETTRERKRNVSKALDQINDKWGEWTIYPARMFGRQKEVIDRIAFGGVKDLEEVYAL